MFCNKYSDSFSLFPGTIAYTTGATSWRWRVQAKLSERNWSFIEPSQSKWIHHPCARGGHAVSARERPMSADLTSKLLSQGGLIPFSSVTPELWQIAVPGFGCLSRAFWSGCAGGPALGQEKWVSAAISPRPSTCTECPTGAVALQMCRISSIMPRLHLTSEEKARNRGRAINGFVYASDSATKYK